MNRNILHIALWAAQLLLALVFGFFGFLKATGDLGELAKMMGWIHDVPALLVRGIGFAEILGAAGMILPPLTRIRPGLTPLAAAGFATIQLLAMALHASRGETGQTIGINLALLGLSLFVIWGRTRAAPIAARA